MPIDYGGGGSTSSGGGSGSGEEWSQSTVSSDYAASDNESLWVDASSNAVTVTLPTPASAVSVRVYALDATNAIEVSPNGTEDLQGSNTNRTLQEDESETYESDGNNWVVI